MSQMIDRAITAYNEVWQSWSNLDANNVDQARRAAMRAAIEAMREPTVEMTQGALDANRVMEAGTRPLKVGQEYYAASLVWRAMISAALKD